MTDFPSTSSTTLGRELWPALLAGARVVVARHASGTPCDYCRNPGGCVLLRNANTYLADPVMLEAEREAADREARPP